MRPALSTVCCAPDTTAACAHWASVAASQRPPRPCVNSGCTVPLCAHAAIAAAVCCSNLQPTDLYFRLRVDRCFYVGQLSGGARAEVRCCACAFPAPKQQGMSGALKLPVSLASSRQCSWQHGLVDSGCHCSCEPPLTPHPHTQSTAVPQVLDGDAYRGAETDPLRTCAAALTRQMNEDRPEDMLRIRWAGGACAQHVVTARRHSRQPGPDRGHAALEGCCLQQSARPAATAAGHDCVDTPLPTLPTPPHAAAMRWARRLRRWRGRRCCGWTASASTCVQVRAWQGLMDWDRAGAHGPGQHACAMEGSWRGHESSMPSLAGSIHRCACCSRPHSICCSQAGRQRGARPARAVCAASGG